MKTQNAEPAAAPAPAKTKSADGIIPPEIIEAAALDAECDRLTTEIAKAKQAAAEAEAAWNGRALIDTDVNDPKQIQALLLVHGRLQFAREKAAVLEPELAKAQKQLKTQADKAGNRVNYVAEEVARGHQELVAQSLVEHFASLDDSRLAARETKNAQEWLEARVYVGGYGSITDMKKVMKLARKVYPELARLREKLGGSIPSAVEMNPFNL